MRKFLSLIAGLFLATAITLAPRAEAQDRGDDWIPIEVGKSTVLTQPRKASTVAITDPRVARVVPIGVDKIQVQGISVGTTDLVIQLGAGDEPKIYQVTVTRDLSDLIREVKAIVEGTPPKIFPLNGRIVVQGPVDDLETLEEVSQVALLYDDKFVNLMSVRGDHQVQMEVVFAEVSRSAIRDLGINVWFQQGNNFGITTEGPNSNSGTSLVDAATGNTLVNAPSVGGFDILGILTNPIQIAAIFSIMDDYKLGKTLAQPKLVTLSGQQAEFLAGGEIPVPSPSGGGNVRVQFKDYGVKLSFVPTVLAGDVIDVRMYMEVSEPDASTGTRLTGIEVPGFITRKVDSHLRIDNGMTFAVAGLMQEETSFSRAQIPFLGELPVIGALFRYVRHERRETELMIFVTPRLVRPLGPGEVPAPPGTAEDNNPGDLEFFLLGMDHRPGSRTARPTGSMGLQR